LLAAEFPYGLGCQYRKRKKERDFGVVKNPIADIYMQFQRSLSLFFLMLS
jgi:hypothetical protein